MSDNKNDKNQQSRTKLKRDDEVIVIAGREKGKRGKIMFIDKASGKIFVQGVNKIKRFQRPSQENPQGGVLEIEAPLHISNVMYYDSKKKKGIRLGSAMDGDKKVRVSRPEGKKI